MLVIADGQLLASCAPEHNNTMDLSNISAGMTIGESGVSIVAWLRTRIARRQGDRALVQQARRHLGIGDPQTYAYRAATLHPLFQRGDPHPDDADALAAVAGESYVQALKQRKLIEVSDLSMSLDDGMVCVGSPETDGIARLAYGYRQRSDGLGMEFVDPPVDLPFRWEEDATKVSAVYSRFVQGKGLVQRPNWPIVDNRGDEKRLYPRVANNGLLQTDYLLVTKVPNYLTRVGFESGRSIITFGGAHGTATRAVDLLLRDRQTLTAVAEQLPVNASGFQLLFEVGSIEHDAARGSRASAIRLAACCVLDRPDQIWERAQKHVAQDLSRWTSEMAARDD